MYSELRWCIDVIAIVCTMVALPMFAGTKRETLWDRSNLIALALLGVALLAHGGFDTFFRSSPRTTFSGYPLGSNRSSGDADASGWLFLYDLGYPPTQQWFNKPSQPVYLPSGRGLPEAVWNINPVWLLRVTYRTRDLQAIRIEGVPVPSAKASGTQRWVWQSDEPLLRPVIETAVGFALLLGAATGLLKRKAADDTSLLRITPAAR